MTIDPRKTDAPPAPGALPTLGRFRRYPAYKDSGVEWLGNVPTHWTESKVKFLGRYINGYPFKPDDWNVTGRPIIRIQNLTNPGTPFNRFAGELDPRYRVTRGDILISWSASLGLFIWPETEDGWLNQHIFKVVLREGSVDRSYFGWLGNWFIRELQKETHGSTMTHLTYGMFGGFRVDLPASEEQRAIATFLDRETARIDALVAKKERLIELLQEQRTALITRAVTKGLDPTFPMKDSGVEWLGETPAHWRVKRLKFLIAKPLKYGANEAAELDDPDLPRYVRITDIDENDSLREDTFKSLPVDVAEEYLLREGDLLFARSGATAGKTFLYRRSWGTCAYAGYLIRARLDTARAHPEFVRYFTASSSYWQWLSATFIQATIQNVSAEKYASLMTPQPPYPEQRAVAEYLDREMARIDALFAKVRDAIDHLKELRTALISAAVTGKIDVRVEVR